MPTNKQSKSDSILKSLEKTILRDKGLTNEMEKSYLDYSMSVIKSRALPDYRDGLKPVHRRIIFAAAKENLRSTEKYKKSAAIVGSVMGSYHPHGDSSIYDALVRMAQDFSMRYPLIQGQGNFGSIDGDAPAAMRYTEARLSKLSDEFLTGIFASSEEDWIDMMDNYDQSKKEPQVLPSLIPNVLVNGGQGIAVGLSTDIPPHNMSEVLDAAIALLDGKTDEEVLSYIQGPDFPTGGIVYGYEGVKNYLNLPHGTEKKSTFRVRAKVEIEKPENKRSLIIVKEIPFGVKKSDIIKRIVSLANPDGKGRYIREIGENVTDIRDESDRNEIRLIIEVKVGFPPEVVLNNLFKHTSLQKSFSANLTVLVNDEPKKLSLFSLLKLYLAHQFDLLEKRFNFRIRKLEERIHILEGRLKVISDSINAVKLITESDNPDKELVDKYGLSEIQLKDILAFPIGRFKKESVDKLKIELNDKNLERNDKKDILANEDRKKLEIRNLFSDLKLAYGDERRTEINREDDGKISWTQTKHFEQTLFIFTQKGFLNQVPLAEYKVKKRENKSDEGFELYKGDLPKNIFSCYGKDDLLFFSGNMVYRKKAYELDVGKSTRGKSINNLIGLGSSDSKDIHVIALTEEDYAQEDLFLIFVTEQGMVKKTSISAFRRVQSKGKIAIKLKPGDKLKCVSKIKDNCELCISARGGYRGRLVRGRVGLIRPLSRNSMGRRGIKLGKGCFVSYASTSDAGDFVISISEYGRVSLVPLSLYKSITDWPRAGFVTQNRTQKNQIAEYERELREALQNTSGELLAFFKNSTINKAFLEKLVSKVPESCLSELKSLIKKFEKSIKLQGETLWSAVVDKDDEVVLVTDKNSIKRIKISDFRVGKTKLSSGVYAFKFDSDVKEEKVKISVTNKNSGKEITAEYILLICRSKEKVVSWTKHSPIAE